MDKKETILKIINQYGVIRVRDLAEYGIHREYLYQLVRSGEVEKVCRGIYSTLDKLMNKDAMLMTIAAKIPNSVICLISALSYYDITTEIPHCVWIAVKKSNRCPKIDYPQINVSYISSEAFLYGIKSKKINGVKVNIYSIEKTIADCFKFRNKVTLDVAINALKDVLLNKRVTVDKILEAAEVCRVTSIITPYIEAII